MKTRIFGAKAVPTEHPHNTKIAAIYAFFLPSKTEMGPQMNEDMPIATNTPALVMLMMVVVVVNSEAISGAAGRRDVLEKVMTRVIQLTAKRMIYFRQRGRS